MGEEMVLMKEFRIVMPLSLEEYETAQMYTVIKMQQETATSTEGVEVLENRPFEDNVFGKGHYTSKLYRFQSKIPSWITSFAPADSLIMQEEAWSAYPRCKSVIKCPCFNKLVLTVETIHVADNGKSENVHCLNKEQLKSRQVEIIDIAASPRDYWSYLIGCCDVDFSQFRSVRTARGPLLEGWREGSTPVMTAYKLVTVNAPYWGFGKRLEQAIIAGERALFLETHRHCFAWIDAWYGMSSVQLRDLENQCLAEDIKRGAPEISSAQKQGSFRQEMLAGQQGADVERQPSQRAKVVLSQYMIKSSAHSCYFDVLGMGSDGAKQ